MDTIEFIRQLVAAVRHQTDETMKDLTVEQFNWTPPGSANSIFAIFCPLSDPGRSLRANYHAGETKALGVRRLGG